MTIKEKGHLDDDRLDCRTILPPPAFICRVKAPAGPGFLETVLREGLPSADCDHGACAVEAVHDL